MREQENQGIEYRAVVEATPVPLQETFLYKKSLEYWETRGVFAFTDTGGEVNSGITSSLCHARVFKRIMKAAGLAGEGAPANSQIVEYGAGTAYFADNSLWLDLNSQNPFFGQRDDWQWVVTDLQPAKLESMRPTTTYTDHIKFAVFDVEKPENFNFLENQEIKPQATTRAVVANYLFGALPWQQFVRDTTGTVLMADFQTQVTVMDAELNKAGYKNVQDFMTAYNVNDAAQLAELDWDFYAEHVNLKPIYRKATPEEITPDVELALALSGGTETVVNNVSLTFLRKVLATLGEEAICFGNEFMADRPYYDQRIKEKGNITPHMLGGSFAIGVNFELIKAALSAEGYVVNYTKALNYPYGLFTISKRELPELAAELETNQAMEDAFVTAIEDKQLKNAMKNDLPKEERLEVIKKLEQIISTYGSAYGPELQLAYHYNIINDIDQAIKHAEMARLLSPHDKTVFEFHQKLLWHKQVLGLVI